MGASERTLVGITAEGCAKSAHIIFPADGPEGYAEGVKFCRGRGLTVIEESMEDFGKRCFQRECEHGKTVAADPNQGALL